MTVCLASSSPIPTYRDASRRTITRLFSLYLMSFYTPCLCICLSIRPDPLTFAWSHVLLASQQLRLLRHLPTWNPGFFICTPWLRFSLSPQTTHPCLPDLGALGLGGSVISTKLEAPSGRPSVRWVTPRRTDVGGARESELLPSSSPCLLHEMPMLPHLLLSFQSPAPISSHPTPQLLTTCLTGMHTYPSLLLQS